MKQGRNLTVAERKHLQSLGLKYKHWLISKKLLETWELVSRTTGQSRTISAP